MTRSLNMKISLMLCPDIFFSLSVLTNPRFADCLLSGTAGNEQGAINCKVRVASCSCLDVNT